MSLALVVLALGCLVTATYLWQRNKHLGIEGLGTGGRRIAIIVLILAGVLLALASQLSIFKG